MNLILTVINSNYYDIDQLQALKKFTDKSSFSFFHLNTNSLSKNIDDFEHFIQSKKTDLDIIAVSESRLTKNKLPLIDISIPNYTYKFCPVELESTFIEIFNTKKQILLLDVSINIQA